MSARKCALGIDIGTGSSRAAAFDLKGKLLFSQARNIPSLTRVQAGQNRILKQYFRRCYAPYEVLPRGSMLMNTYL
jgi:ribulose kinase